MDRLRWRAAALIGGLLAVGVLVAPPGINDALRLTLLIAVMVAMVTGILANRPGRARAWWLMVAAVGAFAAAAAVRMTGIDQSPIVDRLADVVVLSGYLLITSAALALARGLDVDGDRDGVVDGAIVAVAVATIVSVIAFQPALLEASGPSRVHLFVGPVVYAAIAGIISRFALLVPRGCAAAWLLVIATAAALLGNILRTMAVAAADGFATGSLADILLVVSYVALGVAAVHPSMAMLSHALAAAPVRTRLRLTLLGAALLVPPTLLVLDPPDPGRKVAAVAAAVLNVLVLWRFARLFNHRERANSELYAQSRSDALTGIANRLRADEFLEDALARSHRSGGPVGLLFCDLDNFKAINDRFGHTCGDQVLSEVARRMQQTIRGSDLLARLSGDEFVVITEGLQHAHATLLAQRIKAAVNAPMRIGGETISTGISVGVQLYGGRGSAIDLMRAADLAMYAAKQERRAAAGSRA